MKFKVVIGSLVPHQATIVVEADDPDAACRLAIVQAVAHDPVLVPDHEQPRQIVVFSFSLAAPHEDESYPATARLQ